MRRRTFLRRVAAGGTALGGAGCLDRGPAPGGVGSTGSPAANRSTSTADAPTATPRTLDGTPGAGTPASASGVPRRVRLEGVDDGELRSAFDVAARASVAEPRVTPKRTARVSVTLGSRGGDRALTYEAETCDLNLMTGVRSGSDARLFLAPADVDWTTASGDCWRTDHRNVTCGIPVTNREVDLPADEDVTWRFGLWAAPDGPCMPPGRYEFERTFDGGAATLALTLRLTVPDS